MYQALRASRSRFEPVRHLSYHLLEWGRPVPGQAPLVLLHGWMDVAASWQFMVDALTTERWVIAPDWRGFGRTRSSPLPAAGAGAGADVGAGVGAGASAGAGVGTRAGIGDENRDGQAPGPAADNFWFPDYLADLDFLLDRLTGEQPVDLVGHSMGGNVAMVYAGVRPQRIRRLVNLEGFGMPETRASQAPERYARWMDELKALHRGELDLKPYDGAEGVARRLMKTNPRLPADKAHWLAAHWAAPDASGQWHVLGDPAHKVVSAQLYRLDETLELYRRITAPVLSVTASDDSLYQWWKGHFTLQQYLERLKVVRDLRSAVIDDAAHMLHHDQPRALAALLESFLA